MNCGTIVIANDALSKTYDFLCNGMHVIRRSEIFWAGLSADYVVETVLMRSLKTNGGLSRKRGFTEQQRTLFCKSMPVMAALNKAMQAVTNTLYTTSEQHQQDSLPRQARDCKDIQYLKLFLNERSTFAHTASIRNIATGEVGDKHV